jgi:uncharacterized protein (DUF2252 family)
MPIAPIRTANKAYEAWLSAQLGGEIVKRDLRAKHEKMSDGPFPFLRATYWRWAEGILEVCPKLKDAPSVLAVGDIHLENFGTWRDLDGRLIWGVNDFDESADMPYVLDLVRLGTSAVLGCPGADTTEDICAQVLKGYRRGLENPHAIVLDQDFAWLRELVVVSEEERERFWAKVEGTGPSKAPPKRYARILIEAMPEPKLKFKYYPRTAGAGSLGRPRWVSVADWHSGPVLREAKALVPSAWIRSYGGSAKPRCYEIASGRYRAIDPWYAVSGSIVVRRLSPNNRKLDAEDYPIELTSKKMLRAMGRELASIHLGTGKRHKAIMRDLENRSRRWLVSSVERAVHWTLSDYRTWKKG